MNDNNTAANDVPVWARTITALEKLSVVAFMLLALWWISTTLEGEKNYYRELSNNLYSDVTDCLQRSDAHYPIPEAPPYEIAGGHYEQP